MKPLALMGVSDVAVSSGCLCGCQPRGSEETFVFREGEIELTLPLSKYPLDQAALPTPATSCATVELGQHNANGELTRSGAVTCLHASTISHTRVSIHQATWHRTSCGEGRVSLPVGGWAAGLHNPKWWERLSCILKSLCSVKELWKPTHTRFQQQHETTMGPAVPLRATTMPDMASKGHPYPEDACSFPFQQPLDFAVLP